MKTLTRVLGLFFFLSTPLCYAYSQSNCRGFDLSRAKFDIFMRSSVIVDHENPSVSVYTLKVKVPVEVKETFSKLSKATVIQLLKDTTTDWLTNLLLYEKYKKDAHLFFSVIHTREDWLPIKATEIRFWEANLK